MLRWLLVLVVLLALTASGAWIVAGRTAPPVLTISKPEGVVGQRGELSLSVGAPHDSLTAVSAVLEQSGQSFPLF